MKKVIFLLLAVFNLVSCGSDDTNTIPTPQFRPQQITVDGAFSEASFTYDFSYNDNNQISAINMVRDEIVEIYRFNTSIIYNENDQATTIQIIDVDNSTIIQMDFDYDDSGIITDIGWNIGGADYDIVVENDGLSYGITSPDNISVLPLVITFDENNRPTSIENSGIDFNISYGSSNGVFYAIDVPPALNIWFQFLYTFSKDMYFFSNSNIESYSINNGEIRTLFNEQRDDNGNLIDFVNEDESEIYRYRITYQPIN